MNKTLFATHEGLAASTRLPAHLRTSKGLFALEMGLLILAGATASLLTAYVNYKLRIPGHAILRAVLPMSLGLALVPRRMAGTVMGFSALVTMLILSAGSVATPGLGAITSLCLTGPLLDAALWQARKGWRVYLGFALAGLASNLIAFSIRSVPKILGMDLPDTRSLEEWWLLALLTYGLCGILAGLLSAFILFRFGKGKEAHPEQEPRS